MDTDDTVIRDYLMRHFEKNLADASPDVTIRLKIDTQLRPEHFKPGTHYEYHIQDESFDFGPGLIQGIWDATARTCCITAAAFLFTREHAWLFDRYLCRLFYTLCAVDNNSNHTDIIVHGAGISRKETGFLFCGPPGSGKSTVAGLSGKNSVLHDDMNIVSMVNGEIFLEGVPFNPKCIERQSGRVPLARIFSLYQAPAAGIDPLTPAAAVKKLLPETFLPLTVTGRKTVGAFQILLTALQKLCTAVPCYTLKFTKDASFWKIIDTLEETHGRN